MLRFAERVLELFAAFPLRSIPVKGLSVPEADSDHRSRLFPEGVFDRKGQERDRRHAGRQVGQSRHHGLRMVPAIGEFPLGSNPQTGSGMLEDSSRCLEKVRCPLKPIEFDPKKPHLGKNAIGLKSGRIDRRIKDAI